MVEEVEDVVVGDKEKLLATDFFLDSFEVGLLCVKALLVRRWLGLWDRRRREEEEDEVWEGRGLLGLVYECGSDVPFKGSSEL